MFLSEFPKGYHFRHQIYILTKKNYTRTCLISDKTDILESFFILFWVGHRSKVLLIMIITILQVVSVERQLDLNNCPSISTGHAAEDSVSSLSPSLSIDSGFSSIREKPQQTQMFGESSEMDIPESRTEFNEDMGAVELPSVNRLKALFNAGKGDDSASVKRVSRN